jgi:hypothetical protein
MVELSLTVPLCEGFNPPKSRAVPRVALNGMGGRVAETLLDLRGARDPEGGSSRALPN